MFVGTTLVSVYRECGSVGHARKVFDEMTEPNVVAWNAVLTTCFQCGDVEVAEEVFGSMPLRDSTSWILCLRGMLRRSSCFDEAFGFFGELQREGVGANEASLTGVLSACVQAGAIEFGKVLHGLVESGFLSLISVNNVLLDMYSKSGNVEMALLVFETMPERKIVVSWTSMIAALKTHPEFHPETRSHLNHERGLREEERRAAHMHAKPDEMVSRRGEMAPRRGEIASRREIASKRGEIASKRGEMAPRKGEIAPRRGLREEERRTARMHAKPGEMVSRRGEMAPKRGEVASKRGEMASK
ncbi:hypothetical protein ACLB2K_014125 [Fragaria x ananassa]